MTCPFSSRASSQLQPWGPSAVPSPWEHISLAPSSSAPPNFWTPTDKTEGAVSLKILEDIKTQSGPLWDPLTESNGAGRDVLSLLRKAVIQPWHHVSSASITHSGITGDVQGEVGWPENVYLVEIAVVSVVREPTGRKWLLMRYLKSLKDHL